MDIIEQIGSYAGLASLVGLAVLSALYFSQARDVKRLREWAGRAPERAAEQAGAQPPVPGRVTAQPQRAPVQQAPRPGAPPPVPAAAAAAGARPAASTPAAQVKQPTPAGANAGNSGGPAPAAAPAQAAAAAPGTQEKQPAPAGANAGGAATAPQPAAPPPATTPGPQPSTPAAKPPSGPPAPAAAPRQGGGTARPGAPGRPSPQPTVILPPPRDPWYRRLTSSPRYLALAIVGVLIVGGAAAFGIVQLVGSDDGSGSAQQPPAARDGGGGAAGGSGGGGGRADRSDRQAVNPANVRVAVLNGTLVPGLAAQIGDRVERFGFQLGTVANGPNQQRPESVVLFSPGHRREAALVSRRLRIDPRERVDPESQALAGDATVVVIAGADRTQ
jgi:hypothetical protein